jgi:hypothetical protein
MRAFLGRKVGLVLTVLSLIVGLFGVFRDDEQYLLCAFIVPAAIVLVVVLRRWRNIPVSNGQYLELDQADRFVYQAVEPIQYPVCAHESVSHSIGAAIAALAARAVLRSIELLLSMILERQIQMQNETDFTPDVVERHIERLRRIQAIVTGLLSKSNIWVKCYGEMSDSKLVIESLHEIRRKLDEDMVEKLEEFYRSIPKKVGRHQVDPRWGPLIKTRITVAAPRSLSQIQKEVQDVWRPARDILKELDGDWTRDIGRLHKDQICTPPSLRECLR